MAGLRSSGSRHRPGRDPAWSWSERDRLLSTAVTGVTDDPGEDGNEIGKGRFERTVPGLFSLDEGLHVGLDSLDPVVEDSPRGTFNGTIGDVLVEWRCRRSRGHCRYRAMRASTSWSTTWSLPTSTATSWIVPVNTAGDW